MYYRKNHILEEEGYALIQCAFYLLPRRGKTKSIMIVIMMMEVKPLLRSIKTD